jgi:hypothetical protein
MPDALAMANVFECTVRVTIEATKKPACSPSPSPSQRRTCSPVFRHCLRAESAGQEDFFDFFETLLTLGKRTMISGFLFLAQSATLKSP